MWIPGTGIEMRDCTQVRIRWSHTRRASDGVGTGRADRAFGNRSSLAMMAAASKPRSSLSGRGGVLEHPEASHAWRRFGLIRPLRGGGWSVADDRGGWTCCVEQGAYGHRARKATWLYAFGVELPVMRWRARGEFVRLDAGYHTKSERNAAHGHPKRERLKASELAATPIEFRDALLEIARTALDGVVLPRFGLST